MADEIYQLFSGFSEEINNQIADELEEIGKDTVDELKSASPKDTGKYAGGWRYTKDKLHGEHRLTVSNRIYQLTHLLEHGHLNRDGTSRTAAIPHIAPANEEAQRRFLRFMGVDENET